MRTICGLAVSCTVAYTLLAASIPPAEYAARREKLRKSLDGIAVLFGAVEGRDQVFGLRQDSDFYYLTGWKEPGAILMVTPERDFLFLPRRTERVERFQGRRADPADADASTRTGFANVLAVQQFESTLLEQAAQYERVYAPAGPAAADKLQALLPLRRIDATGPLVSALRVKKSAAEIAAIRRATEVSMEAHRAAWRRVQAGVYEYQPAATFTATLLEAGCEGHAYSPIFGAGPNSTILHYSENRRRMDAGEAIVIDAAAECGGYASDITRTLPVVGKWTARQAQIYGYVLGAQKAVIAAIKPGVEIGALTKIARDYLDQFKDDAGDGMSKYLWHGVSHHVGLDVHDAANAGPLEAGMVITVEPGLYLPRESLGVRIEDTILVTDNGAENLSGALPREPQDIEKVLAR